MHPEKVFRYGLVSAAVFWNDTRGGTREMRSVTLERRYKDGDGQWRSTSSFALAELPQAIAALKRAEEYLASREADVTPAA